MAITFIKIVFVSWKMENRDRRVSNINNWHGNLHPLEPKGCYSMVTSLLCFLMLRPASQSVDSLRKKRAVYLFLLPL